MQQFIDKLLTALTRYWPRVVLATALCMAIGMWLLDRHFPLPVERLAGARSVVVLARDDTPLRAFADENGIWRYPVSVDQVSPKFLTALIAYEDRWFFRHPGVNPLALLRAGWQALRNGRIISGGSTLTMQVARLIDPHARSLSGKLKQILRALQLEWHYDKQEILTLYVNLAPYGGPLQGVEAASFAYLGKSARHLSHAEAALLAVLPQSPSRFRPDRFPRRAQNARDKVLTRLHRFGVWDASIVTAARREVVLQQYHSQPMIAPLFARRLRAHGAASGVVHTTLDAGLQLILEDKLQAYLGRFPIGTSAAVLVMENQSLAVRAYLGSADFNDARRYGHVDMITALRSPGSTLKPFLYGLALDAGMIHSESLLSDAPQSFDGYRPLNFTRQFSGPVSVTQALQQSLNVPAVDLLARYGAARFVAQLRHAGLRLQIPGGRANLSVILGGVGTGLESLVGVYSSLARAGLSATPRLLPQQPRVERRMLSAGAAWIVRDMLEQAPRPGGYAAGLTREGRHRLAWKTGTSYGFHDAWAVGVSDGYTLGVWIGRPDGTSSPGEYGALTAAPLLFDIAAGLPLQPGRPPRPTSVHRQRICWPLGEAYDPSHAELCHQQRQAWVLNKRVPATLPDRVQQHWRAAVQRIWIDPQTGRRVLPSCSQARPTTRLVARWPTMLQPWLRGNLRVRSRIPRWDDACLTTPNQLSNAIRIVGLAAETVVRPAGVVASAPQVNLAAVGAQGDLYWIVNNRLSAVARGGRVITHTFTRVGDYEVTALDETGAYDRVRVRVLAGSAKTTAESLQ